MTDDDPWGWLEDVAGERALAWVRAQNERSAWLLAEPVAAELRPRLLAILDAADKIPFVSLRHGLWYNFWQDATHVRGLLRRTTWASYLQPEPVWEPVLDLDALARDEGENWVVKSFTWRHPECDRLLLCLSRGGADATVVREFDPQTRTFVRDGFALPEAKHTVGWKDLDTLYVGTDFGPGSMTTSGYPRIAKEWRRGTPLAAAPTLFEGQPTDVAAGVSRDRDHGTTYDWAVRSPTFFTSEVFLLRDGQRLRIDVPDDASPDTFCEQLLVTLRSPWTTGGRTWPAGALLAIDLAAFLRGDRAFTMLWEPAPDRALLGRSALRSGLLLNELIHVQNKLSLLLWRDGTWQRRELPDAGGLEQSAWPVDGDRSDEFFVLTSGHLTPSTLARGAVGVAPTVVKQAPVRFAADGLATTQHFASSRDGTRVPYFQIGPRELAHDGSTPTLLYGYGGFQVSLTPGYDALTGAAWLERGGVQVVANIRGGGEYGPQWHEAARKADRQRAFDDFIAVAEDLIRRGVTSPRHLGITGASNGGLLMGVMLTQRPDLFAAIVAAVPLADMLRYHRLLAGASWIAEYGDPEIPAERELLRGYSPYHNLRQDRRYPPVLFTTSTRDDRVHPAHARKMVARMQELGHEVLYYENVEGGHGGAADHAQTADLMARQYAFLWRHLR